MCGYSFRSERWDGPNRDWNPAPDLVSQDPHNADFDVIDPSDLDAGKVDGPVPDNIVRGTIPGPFSRSKGL